MVENVCVAEKDGYFGILSNDKEVVPFTHRDKNDAIEEWEYFQKLNTNLQPHKRFLKKVISIEEINETVLKLKTKC